ncbi:cytochrome b5-like protein isoform X1 [Tanacetum coccineum]|uniref:Cytochrome b5-like protein isoform X1 n=1 Tax=Tanacetum coccineum TaxID=301880 RepID=A0ABQ5D952_9ASTR
MVFFKKGAPFGLCVCFDLMGRVDMEKEIHVGEEAERERGYVFDQTNKVHSDVKTKTVKTYNKAEVSLHNKRTDCWIVIKDKVYDVTPYVEEHPGGDAILAHAGDDSTEGFFGDNMSEAQRMPLTGSFNYGNGHMNGVISLRSSASRVMLLNVNFNSKPPQWHQLDKDLMEIFYKSFQDRYQYEDNVAPETARHVWEGRAKIRFRGLWVLEEAEKKTGSSNPAHWTLVCLEVKKVPGDEEGSTNDKCSLDFWSLANSNAIATIAGEGYSSSADISKAWDFEGTTKVQAIRAKEMDQMPR